MGVAVTSSRAIVVLLLVLSLAPTTCRGEQQVSVNGEVIVAYSSADNLEQLKASIAAQGCEVLRGVDGVQALVARCGDPAAGGNGAVAAATASTAGTQLLSGLPGVTMAVANTVLQIPRQPDLSQSYTAAAAQTAYAGSCAAAADPKNPDMDLGRGSEGVPYGIRMIQADTPEVVEVSRLYNRRVMWCVIDSGLDRRNQEFPPGVTGCRPTMRRNRNNSSASPRLCMHWDSDGHGHGTHVAGIIAATNNGRGVVGASAAAAQLYVYKFLHSSGKGTADRELAAWADCVAELDARKAAGRPNLKMVISMSYGSYEPNSFSQAFLTNTSAARDDILWFAAAGNDKIAAAMYPAAYKGVIAVSAVDWTGKLASFSNYGDDIFLAAPGTSVLSTVPLALTRSSSYYLRDFAAVTTQPELPEVQQEPNFFGRPGAVVPIGSSLAEVTAPLVDCGLGLLPCANATGSICLIQGPEPVLSKGQELPGRWRRGGADL